jgi:hypothetical protein
VHLAGAAEEEACNRLFDLLRSKDLRCDEVKYALLRLRLARKGLEGLNLVHAKLWRKARRVLFLLHAHHPALLQHC